MMLRRMFVHVWSAAVLAGGVLAATMLLAEDPSPATQPQNGKVTGILIAKTDKDITIKADGETETRKFQLPAGGGPRIQKMLFIPNLVELEWKTQDQQRVVTAIHEIVPRVNNGVIMGTVVAVDSSDGEHYVDVKPVQGFTERYWPRWIGKFDVDMIRDLKVGDKVKVTWTRDERKRAIQIQVTAKAPATAPASQAALTKPASTRMAEEDISTVMPQEMIGFRGTVAGTVAKPPGKDWFVMKVVKVVGFEPSNKVKLSADALTAVWKDKYVAVLLLKNMPQLDVSEPVTVRAFQFEAHLRSIDGVIGKQNPSGPTTRSAP